MVENFCFYARPLVQLQWRIAERTRGNVLEEGDAKWRAQVDRTGGLLDLGYYSFMGRYWAVVDGCIPVDT